MQNYIFYTGIILLVWGFVGFLFIFFFCDIVNTFKEWKTIKNSELGFKLSASKKHKMKKDAKKSKNRISSSNAVSHSDMKHFGKSLTDSGLTEILIFDDEPEQRQDGITNTNAEINEQTGILRKSEDTAALIKEEEITAVLIDTPEGIEGETAILDSEHSDITADLKAEINQNEIDRITMEKLFYSIGLLSGKLSKSDDYD